jgi:hypothetical protein
MATIKKEKLARTALKTAREQAAKTIIDLRNGDITPLTADAIYKQSISLVDNYRVELRAIELAIMSSEGLDFSKAATMIDTKDK